MKPYISIDAVWNLTIIIIEDILYIVLLFLWVIHASCRLYFSDVSGLGREERVFRFRRRGDVSRRRSREREADPVRLLYARTGSGDR